MRVVRTVVLLAIGVGGFFVYQYNDQQVHLCSRYDIKSLLTKILSENNIGTELTVNDVRTLRRDGNVTNCAADFVFRALKSNIMNHTDDIEYNVTPTDDGQKVYVEIPGTSMYKLKDKT